MKKRKLHAFDMSSFMWNSLLVGKDKEGHSEIFNEKEVWINSCWYGLENVLNRMIDIIKKAKANPIDCILVFEGQSSKAKRQLINSGYKAGSDKAPGMYTEFEKLREELKLMWHDLGAQILYQDFAEGDDVLAWLAKNTEDDLTVYTFDNDLTTLNFTNAYGAKVSTWINQMTAFNKYGLFDYHLVTTYKALIGDASDKIVGCPGFGPGKWEDLVAGIGYDGVQEIHNMLMQSDLDPLADCLEGYDKKTTKALTLIVDNAPTVINSFDLAKLRPEWVNTMTAPLHWEPGMVRQRRKDDDPRLKPWYGEARLITADTFGDDLEWALPLIEDSHEIALDIETSSTDESDEWLTRKEKAEGVDQFGSKLSGLSLTFGRNNQYSLYVSVDHADTENVDSDLVRQLVALIPRHVPIIIQNFAFEACVLFNEWGLQQMDNGYYGYLPNVLDTKIEGNYVDENTSVGLKQRSHSLLGYRQQTYEETTVLTGAPGTLPAGGRHVRDNYEYRTVGTGIFEPLTAEEIEAGYQPVELTSTELVTVPVEQVQVDDEGNESLVTVQVPKIATETRRYKMNELTAKHVFGYGIDDTICTIALHNYYKMFMQFEHSWGTYLQVEIDAMYANAAAFTSGIPFSLEQMLKNEAHDKELVEQAWPVLREYLMAHGWEGTVAPGFSVNIEPSEVKEAFRIVTGRELDTAMRTPSKLLIWIREHHGEVKFAGMLERLYAAREGDDEAQARAALEFTRYVNGYFKGEPNFNCDSPVQMKRLLYEVMGLPIRIRNKLTDVQRAKGEREGTAKTDDLAVQNALHYDANDENRTALKAIQVLKQCSTRNKLFYKPYRAFPHWKDGLLHPNTNQCATVTRRNSASEPNYTQWPAKGEGIKFRECIVARGPKRVIISSDSSGQELRLVAELSRDKDMLACYIGDNKRDIHSLVSATATKYLWERELTYDEFFTGLKSPEQTVADKYDAMRTKTKVVNFGEIYGMQAEALSHKLFIPQAEAQLFLDAKKERFPMVDDWKAGVESKGMELGYSTSMLGGRRHLAEILTKGENWKISKALRQLSNFEIQSSGAEAVKIALGKCFFSEVMRRCDVHILGSIHDEIVLDCPAEHAYEVATELVKFMSAPYANMIVPFVSETTIGIDFGKQLKLPLGFTPADVQKRLDELFKEAA